MSTSPAILFAAGLPLFAQNAAEGPSPFLQSFGNIMPLVMIGLLFFFMILRPQQRERQRHEELLKQLKKNDKVLTSGGIFGVVANVDVESGEVTIRVDEKNDTKLRMQLSAVAKVLAEAEPAAKTDTT